MNSKVTLLGATVFLVATLSNLANARNSPNIFNKDTQKVFSVRNPQTIIFTFQPDGGNPDWVREMTGLAGLNAITYGHNTYVAVGNDGTIWYSTNNATWQEAVISGYASFNAVEYGGNGRFVAVATEGTIWYSDDGAKWTESLSPDLELYDPDFYDVIYAQGVFIAVGVSIGPVPTIFSSIDGESWRVSLYGQYGLSGSFESIAYGNNSFVAVGTNGNIYVSNDGGQLWKNVSLPMNSNPYYDNSLHSVTYGNGIFVAVGDNAYIWYSNDGTTWKLASGIQQSTMTLSSVTYGNGVFVAVVSDTGVDLVDKPIWYSPDGVNWQAGGGIQPNPCASNVYSVFDSVDFLGSFFIATSRNTWAFAHHPEYYSPDGMNWSSIQQTMGGCQP